MRVPVIFVLIWWHSWGNILCNAWTNRPNRPPNSVNTCAMYFPFIYEYRFDGSQNNSFESQFQILLWCWWNLTLDSCTRGLRLGRNRWGRRINLIFNNEYVLSIQGIRSRNNTIPNDCIPEWMIDLFHAKFYSNANQRKKWLQSANILDQLRWIYIRWSQILIA